MSDIISKDKHVDLSIENKNDVKNIINISKALSSPERVAILRAILYKSKNLYELSKELKMPLSSISRHVQILADAQLIIINYMPGKKGHSKYCAQAILSYSVSLDLPKDIGKPDPAFCVEMPIGNYFDCDISAPCGINGIDGPIGKFDDKTVFCLPERTNAENLWFDKGFVSYRFPVPTEKTKLSSLSFSFEICSETVYFNNNWPSDITVYINDTEVISFTSPGDFGGRRGNYTPEYWPITSTQFGLLQKITVTEKGVYYNDRLSRNGLKLEDLKINENYFIKFSIGIKEDAVHKGGINLFGKNFGDFNQAIIMELK